MRKLMWFTLGFGAACGLCVSAVPGGRRIWLTVGALGLMILAAVMGRRLPVFRRAAVVILGCAMGFAWFSLFDGFYLRTAAERDSLTHDAVIRASDYSYETDYGMAVDGTESPTACVPIWRRVNPSGRGTRCPARSVSGLPPRRANMAEPTTPERAFSFWHTRRMG